MLGWEFPPVFSGGLGVVTKNLIESLLKQGQDVTLLLPQFIAEEAFDAPQNSFLKTSWKKSAEKIIRGLKHKVLRVPTSLRSPYVSGEGYKDFFSADYWEKHERFFEEHTASIAFPSTKKGKKKNIYGEKLFLEIDRFVLEVLASTEGRDFDVVHAHDWITAEAGIQLKLQRGIPLLLHIHATEFDRIGNNPEESEVFRREKYAMEVADKVIAVSHYTKGILVNLYGIDPDKIEVVHNAYTRKSLDFEPSDRWKKDKSQFWALFIGRVTLQKGPDYFVEMAKKVMKVKPNIHFLIVGDGDMMPSLVQRIARENLHENIHCLGFLSPEDRDALYLFTDACVIPSVSEPFGLTAIEGVFHHSPLVLSKTCGANELIHHKLSVDFWDTESMAEYILALEKYPILRRTLRKRALEDLPNITWDTQALQVIDIYNSF